MEDDDSEFALEGGRTHILSIQGGLAPISSKLVLLRTDGSKEYLSLNSIYELLSFLNAFTKPVGTIIGTWLR